MKIAALKERANNEKRAAISPDVAKLFVKKGYNIYVEKGIGEHCGFFDQAYIDVGAKVSHVPLEVVSDADIILKVLPSPLNNKINELEFAKKESIIIGLLSPYYNIDYLKNLAKKQISAIAMELVPRISKTQNMDVLSSQSNLAGYRAVLEAAYHFNRAFPMIMSAAGMIAPAKVLIIGVGVAGLQAIATAKRLGAIVAAYDVRTATKEQVESLGAKFIFPDNVNDDLEDSSGYAKEASTNNQIKTEEFLISIIKDYDIIITTAQIPGKQAPTLVTDAMLSSMKPGAVIVDMATSSGGNVKGSEKDQIIDKDGIKIIGWSNLASHISKDSTRLYSRNLYNFLDYALKNGTFNFEDEVVKQMLLIKNGTIINKQLISDK